MRSTNVGSGLATTFGTIPFENTPAGNLSETRLTAQQSRVNLLATTTLGSATVRGFFEVDFLGNGPGNAFVYANSHTVRLRHAWAQYARGGYEFTAGQTWTLLTPNRTGLSPVSADVLLSQVLDANLQLGLVWARQNQFRLVAHPAGNVAAGVSLENPQPFVGSAVVLPEAFPAGQVDAGSTPGAPSPYPDIIGKVAFDPNIGQRHQHLEAALVVRGFRTYDPVADTTFSTTGTGVSVGAVIEPVRNISLIGNAFWSSGGGRYMIGQAPDFMVNADGSPSPIGSTSVLGGVEAQVRPMTMLFAYYGTVRIDQKVASDAGTPIGYGVAGSTSANRSIDETTVGFNRALVREAAKGAVHLIFQYSYVKRTPWSVPDGAPTSAHAHMFFVSARYILP
ncbi:MAG TPA: hypothetical protein VFV78_04525 [Vicinamibacterales bacterium]|nr:hypothetical protein [Vicinamibacterales bacterium]